MFNFVRFLIISIALLSSNVFSQDELIKNNSTTRTTERNALILLDVPEKFKSPFTITVSRNPIAANSPQLVSDLGSKVYPNGSKVYSHYNTSVETTREYTYPDYSMLLALTLCENKISATDAQNNQFNATIIRDIVQPHATNPHKIIPGQQAVRAPDGTVGKSIQIWQNINSKGESIFRFKNINPFAMSVKINMFDEYNARIKYRKETEELDRTAGGGRGTYHSMMVKTLEFEPGEEAIITLYLKECEEAAYNAHIYIISSKTIKSKNKKPTSPASIAIFKAHQWKTTLKTGDIPNLDKNSSAAVVQYNKTRQHYRIFENTKFGSYVTFFISDNRPNANHTNRFGVRINIPLDIFRTLSKKAVTEIDLPYLSGKANRERMGVWSSPGGFVHTTTDKFKRIEDKLEVTIPKSELEKLGGKVIIKKVYEDGTIMMGFDFLLLNEYAKCEQNEKSKSNKCELDHYYIEGATIIKP